VLSLQAGLQALQDQLAWASSSAAAAASAAATDAVEEVKEQLEDLQGQLVCAVALSRSATGAAGHMQAAATAAGADSPADGQAAAAAVQPLVCRSGKPSGKCRCGCGCQWCRRLQRSTAAGCTASAADSSTPSRVPGQASTCGVIACYALAGNVQGGRSTGRAAAAGAGAAVNVCVNLC
jgi:hypothetical protein